MSKDFFSEKEKTTIISAIQEAEKSSSGEIRVHVEPHCKIEVLDRAAEVFAMLKMHKTELRNGVLFYVAYQDHKFAILGDAGINAVVSPDFWDKIKEMCIASFKHGQYAEGLAEGIKMAGLQLKSHFPYQKDDVNELPDDISFGQ